MTDSSATHEFPPEPWRMRATAHVALWRIPSRDLPAVHIPVRSIRAFGKVVVATVWVKYLPGSALEYNELAFVIPHFAGFKLAATSPLIWVDSAAARAGGRALWAIPKELATFEVSGGVGFMASVRVGSQGVATLKSEPRKFHLPLRAAVRLVHAVGNRTRVARAAVQAKCNLELAQWEFARCGPLGFFADQKPFFCAQLVQARMVFSSG